MTEIIRLRTSSIKNIPLQNYENDFTFFVNGKEFKTSHLAAELLSPNICKMHAIDPIMDSFTINTTKIGNFSTILDLLKFDQISFPINEIPFIFEVFDSLGNQFLKFSDFDPNIQITSENVLTLLHKQQICEKFYEKNILQEINYASTHFYEICETKFDEFKKLPYEIIDSIINNNQLRLNSEDQLMSFINKLYVYDQKYSFLYESVYFENVSPILIQEFASIFDQEDLSRITWLALLSVFQNGDKKHLIPFQRYNRKHKIFEVNKNEIFKGIIYYLQSQPDKKIDDNLSISASSVIDNHIRNQPNNVILYDDLGRRFFSSRQNNSWICFDFKDNKVAPTDYTIRSIAWNSNSCHPKSWVIEGSNDKIKWEILDEKINCPLLNGSSIVKTFPVKNEMMKEFRFIRLRSTGKNWSDNSYLAFESFEIYGSFYPK